MTERSTVVVVISPCVSLTLDQVSSMSSVLNNRVGVRVTRHYLLLTCRPSTPVRKGLGTRLIIYILSILSSALL